MGRFILAFLLLLGAYLLIRKLGRSNDATATGSVGSTPAAAEASNAEEMVQCRHCNVHVPRSEVVFSQGFTFCSTAHRDLYSQAASGKSPGK